MTIRANLVKKAADLLFEIDKRRSKLRIINSKLTDNEKRAARLDSLERSAAWIRSEDYPEP